MTHELAEHQRYALDYIEQLLTELGQLAARSDLTMLAFYIGCAVSCAGDIRTGKRPPDFQAMTRGQS